MASKRKKTARRRKKNDSPLWQWALVALAAFLIYKGIDYYLGPREKGLSRPPSQTATSQKSSEGSASPSQSLGADITGPIKKWDFAHTEKFLPKNAYPDNFQPTQLEGETGALVAYAKTLPGVEPGPQGLTKTQPGLRWVKWTGKDYQTEDLSFEKLDTALGEVSSKMLEGLPRVGTAPFWEGDVKIYPTRLFLKNDNREIMAYLKVGPNGIDWAPLKHVSGKKMPAAFVLGTTAEQSRQVRHRKYAGRNYLIIENGILDELKAYEGYQWSVQAYYWDKGQFVFDADYSKNLTEAKRSAKN